MPDIGVLICGHGSRDTAGTREVAAFAAKVARRFPHWPLDYAFLEFAEPTLRDGLAKLRAAGVRRIVAAPNLLFEAHHARHDIPSVLDAYAHEQAGQGVAIAYAKALGIDPKMLRAAADRIEEAEQGAGTAIPRAETLLMVAGRGTSDLAANGDLAKLARMLCEGMEFGGGAACYSGVTTPQTAPALEQAAKLGFRRIVVLPYFLFTGALVARVYAAIDEVAARHPGIEFLKARYLNDHPLIVATLTERILEAVEGPDRPLVHHHHDHDSHADCNDEWHAHAPAESGDDDLYSLAPVKP